MVDIEEWVDTVNNEGLGNYKAYNKIREIGRGGYSVVSLVERHGIMYAMKEPLDGFSTSIDDTYGPIQWSNEDFMREISRINNMQSSQRGVNVQKSPELHEGNLGSQVVKVSNVKVCCNYQLVAPHYLKETNLKPLRLSPLILNIGLINLNSKSSLSLEMKSRANNDTAVVKNEKFNIQMENVTLKFSCDMLIQCMQLLELRQETSDVVMRMGVVQAIEEIVSAVMQMSFRRCGALIIFERQIGMAAIINSAVTLETKINSLLVQAIFYPNSPLHDGAVIVRHGIIAAAHAILPLSQDEAGTRDFGTRHRAAIGVTEETDAVAVVVSEETGTISVAYRGRLIRNLSETDLLAFLKKMLIDYKQVSSIYEKFSDLDDQKTLALSSVDDEEDHDVIK